MSKCDLRIIFDRADRTYRGGEEVNGTVYIEVNQDVECKGILLEGFWRTHGRGNTATGPKATSVLYQGTLRAGESLSYPFRFTAPEGPPTYHGRYLNIDHYLNVRVDIPWAIDPKLKEEYILLPGPRRYGNLPALPGGRSMAKQVFAGVCVPIGVAMIVFGFVLFPWGLVLIPPGLAFIFFPLWKSLAERKIGKVKLSCGSTTVPPGGNLPLRLTFTPRHSSRLNRITAELVGKERCVSGSGTNRTTHTHKFHQQTVVLARECDVAAGRPLQVEGVVPIPETGAFSFHARDNSLIWELQVRVDIPLWPDWVEKRLVIVRPAVEPEVVEATVVEEPSPAAVAPALPAAVVAVAARDLRQPEAEQSSPGTSLDRPEPVAAEEMQSDAEAAAAEVEEPLEDQATTEPSLSAEGSESEAPVEEQEPAASPPSSDAALVGIVERIASADRYSGEREQVLEESSEQSFDCAIEVSKVERTYSYIPDARFRKGRTVTGKLQDTGCEVSVELIEARNEELDSLKPGSLLYANCSLLKWNTIYDRLEMRES